MSEMSEQPAVRATRSAGPVTNDLKKDKGPPIKDLPANFIHYSLGGDDREFQGLYHFAGTVPPIDKITFFRDIQDRAFAIVACTVLTTDSVPARFDPEKEGVATSSTCVPTPWISKCCKFVVYPDESVEDCIDLTTTPIKDIVRGGWLLPKRKYKEHFIVRAHKDKFFYKNPCGHAEFCRHAAGMTSYKKFTESETDESSKKVVKKSSSVFPIVVPAAKKPEKIRVQAEGK
jgi:hypothetical protein